MSEENKKACAPWTKDQVDSLNGCQNSGCFHPFTCGGDRGDAAHKAYAEKYGGDWGQLVATPEGWICPVCGYKQDWAHGMMADYSWKPDAEIFKNIATIRELKEKANG